MLDGPRWATRPTVSDRDLTPRLLEQMMHWGASLRVWLPEWIDSPDAVLDRVDAAIATANERRRRYDEQLAADAEARAAAIAEAEAHPPSEVSDDEPTEDGGAGQTELVWDVGPTDPPPATATDTRLVAGLATAAVPAPVGLDVAPTRDWDGRPAAYQHAPTSTLGERTDLDRLNSPSVRHTITAAARETVQFEGPIALDRLARDIGHRFEFDRVSSNRKEFITSCVPSELIRSTEMGDFVWPRELTICGSPVAERGNGASERLSYRTTAVVPAGAQRRASLASSTAVAISVGTAKGRLTPTRRANTESTSARATSRSASDRPQINPRYASGCVSQTDVTPLLCSRAAVSPAVAGLGSMSSAHTTTKHARSGRPRARIASMTAVGLSEWSSNTVRTRSARASASAWASRISASR